MAKKPLDNFDSETIIKLGRRIKFLRNERNMTQMDVAVLLNIDPSAVRRYERGRVEMGFTTLMKFAEALQVTVNDLLYSEE
ncbi:helix-turn-helix domain-containing protein [Aestuariivivens insulae]|uniref:helix-turn-helix domain-containing protein n=1 Tax=Aestuariivivens insulae TaxID=1621988 RepID=UPI001F59AD26|nr:helix-turn-helix transcriptional regulator [Aestuariivivens insulae]